MTAAACVCRLRLHPQLDLLNAAALNKDAYRAIARRYSLPDFAVSKDVVGRHAARCLGITLTTPQAKAAVKRRSVRAAKSAEAVVEQLVNSVEPPRVRSAEQVQTYNEKLLSALGRRRVVAEARGDDRLFVALIGKETELLAQIERNSGRVPSGPSVTFTQNVSVLDVRQMSDRELLAIASGEVTTLPGMAA